MKKPLQCRGLNMLLKSGSVAIKPSWHKEHGQIGKTQKLSSMTRSSRTFHGAGRFPLLTVFPALRVYSSLSDST